MKIQSEKKQIEINCKFTGRFGVDGSLVFGPYVKHNLKKFIKDNPNMPFELKPLLPESDKQRGWFEGSICPVLAFYQEGMNHHNSNDISSVREWLKMEFNSDLINIGGKVNKVAQSTKRKLNQGFLERVVGYLEDNYSVPYEVLDPECYKNWKDTIFPYGGPDNYLDYLIEIGVLK